MVSNINKVARKVFEESQYNRVAELVESGSSKSS